MPQDRNTRRRKIQVLIIDDHPAVCAGVSSILRYEKDMEVCGCAGSAAQALPAIRKMKPNLAMLDISLPDGDGMQHSYQAKLRPVCRAS